MKKSQKSLGQANYAWKQFGCLACAAWLIVQSGCTSSTETPTTNSDTTSATSNAGGSSKPAAPQRVSMNVAEVEAAKLLVRDAAMQIGFMTDDAMFERSITGAENALGKIDIDAVNKAMELLAKLPDNNDNEFIPTVSKVMPKLKECFSLYQQSLATKKPFSDGSGTGEKMAKLGGDNHLNLVVAVDESKKLVDPVK